jgi:parvulin-like peptidyl-prolyl isomerase
MSETSFEEVAGSEELEVQETDFLTRRSAPSFIKPAFDLEIGQIAAPSTSEDKVYLVKVEAREDADPAQFDSQKEVLRLFVTWEEKERLYHEWLEHLHSRANLVDYQVQKEQAEKGPGGT